MTYSKPQLILAESMNAWYPELTHALWAKTNNEQESPTVGVDEEIRALADETLDLMAAGDLEPLGLYDEILEKHGMTHDELESYYRGKRELVVSDVALVTREFGAVITAAQASQ